MFEEVAIALLKRMGHSGTVPSAILAEDIPQALARLRGALAQEPAEAPPQEGEERVTMSRRAYPLIKMLEAAQAQGCEVMWDR